MWCDTYIESAKQTNETTPHEKGGVRFRKNADVQRKTYCCCYYNKGWKETTHFSILPYESPWGG